MPMKNRTSEYLAWNNAKIRCTKHDHPLYPYYGGRGIRMCKEWLYNPQAFIDYLGPRPPGYVLDRIDNSGDYEPGNVRWTTRHISQINRRQLRAPLYQLGDRVEKWTVQEQGEPKGAHRYWWCVCECGNKSLVAQANLRSGQSKGCRSCARKGK